MSTSARGTLLVLAAAVALAPPAAANETISEMVPMTDGVLLHTAVTLPASGTPPFPAALVRSPYKDDFSEMLLLAANLGYAVVLQDTRGTGASEGEPDAFFTDHLDGPVTADWILEQPWCDGTLSMWGGSALAMPAYLMAPWAPEAMTCMGLAIATPDVYQHGVFHGGVFKKKTVESWTSWVKASSKLELLEEHRLCADWWDPLRVVGLGPEITTPALHLGGWFDVFTEGTLAGFATFSQSADPHAAEHQYLVIGAWEHLGLGQEVAGELTFPDGTTNGIFELILPWLDFCHWSEDPDWPRVRYYVMGDTSNPDAPGNEWREADSWPIPADEVPLWWLGLGVLVLAVRRRPDSA